ncbi:MAG: glycosyltransferase [Pirellulales bacterium]|nr:glycosyltransferase [Pirellulales bacterium]
MQPTGEGLGADSRRLATDNLNSSLQKRREYLQECCVKHFLAARDGIVATNGLELRNMPRLSIVIPVMGRCAAFEAGLVSVLSERPSDCEVVAVLNEPYDNPYELDDEVRFVHAPSGAGWAACANRGLLAAQGEIVNLLDAGVKVDAGWTDAVIAQFRDPKLVAVSSRTRVLEKRTEWAGQTVESGRLRKVKAGQLRRLRHKNTFSPLAAAGFYRREDVVSVCGLEEDLPAELAIADLSLRIHQASGHVAFESTAKVSCVATPDKSAFNQGLGAERFFLMHMDGVSLSGLTVRALRGLPSLVGGRFGPISGLARLCGRLAAWLNVGKAREGRRVRAALISDLEATIDQRLRATDHSPSRPRSVAA